MNADDYFLIDQAFLGQGGVMTASGESSPLSSAADPAAGDKRRTTRGGGGREEGLLLRRPGASRLRRR